MSRLCLLGLPVMLVALPGPLFAQPEAPSFAVLAPDSGDTTTTREFVNVLGRVPKNAKVTVGGKPASVFSSGVFLLDRVPLTPGPNRIEVVAESPGGARESATIAVERVAPADTVAPVRRDLFIESKTIEPDQNLVVAPAEPVEVAFRGTPGMIAEAKLPGEPWRRLDEAADTDTTQPSGQYRGILVFAANDEVASQPLRVRLRAQGRVAGRRILEVRADARIGQWDAKRVRLVRVGNDGADVAFGLHEVRLGGPFLAELTSGTVLRVTGQRGRNLRVQLTPALTGWVSAGDVAPAPPATPIPHLYFTSLSVGGGGDGDVVSIPYAAPVPFAVRAGTGLDGRPVLDVDFYGAHNAATWISHSAKAEVVREATVEQVATDHLRVRVALAGDRLWGYKAEVTTTSLRLTVRKPPQIAKDGSPLKGLTVALEPGHGGSNTGATGVTRVPEKNINRWTVEALKAELEKAGAKVVVVRPGDENLSLGERARRATASNADVFISVHANSAGTANGYLRVSGTSTYYKHSFGRDLAAAIHRRLLEITGLPDFGNVGAFNYTPIRIVTWMPSMLVEQAFMSNPSDEAKMLDPAFRAKTAEAVRKGIEDYLRGK